MIAAEPADIGVTGTETLVVPDANVATGGTLATPVLLETRLTDSGVETGAERFNVRFCAAVPLMVRLVCEKLSERGGGPDPPVTCT